MPRDALPPGPAAPALVQALMLMTGPPYLRRCRRRYGDRFTLRLGRFGSYVYLADPADIRELFHGDDTLLHAGEANAPFLGRVLGSSSVLVTDEELHLRQRRQLSAALHGEAVARMADRMAEVAAADIATWPEGDEFPVLAHMKSITLDVILTTVIGVTDPDRRGPLRQALLDLTEIDVVMLAQFAFPRLARHGRWRRFWVDKARADELLRREIDRARDDPDPGSRDDVLAVLVRAGAAGTPMTADELRDQIATLLLAGHETTATGLAWAIERLVRHPAALSRATAAARSGDDAYIDAVVTETLRARPVVPDVSRLLVGEYRLGEHVLPAGTFVNPAIALVHHDPRSYDRPDEFDPDRFLGARPDPTVWLPFGGGNRRCLGAAFAATEMRVVLREVLRRVDLVPSDARPEKARVRHVTLAPHAGGLVRVRRPYGSGGPGGEVAEAGGRPSPTRPWSRQEAVQPVGTTRTRSLRPQWRQ